MGSAFISYARADDKDFVARLHADLTARGIDAWWDIVCMPSRGLTFLQEIRDAIDSRERVILVLGPAAVASSYVRAEWQYALVADKIVIPVLRRGGFELLPPEFKNLDCVSFTDDAAYGQSLDKLLADLRAPPPPLARLSGVPSPPPHFRPRGRELSELARLALADLREPRVLSAPERATVVHGMGGIGKSVLAAAFARSTETRRAFRDGIFWLDQRTAVAPRSTFEMLARYAGVEAMGGPTGEATAEQLAQVLAGRANLIVLDNVTSLAQVEPFVDLLALAPRTHLLVTTREGSLVTALGCGGVDIGQLAEDAALELLADWSGQSLETMPSLAHDVGRVCGGLPFALALCGAMVRDGNTWGDLLGELEHANLAFIEAGQLNYPYPDLLKCFQVSLDLLGRTHATGLRCYRATVVFAPGARIPEAALVGFWCSLADIPEALARKLLVTLERKALLRVEGHAPTRWVTLHDLQHAFLRATTAVSEMTALHDALTRAYRSRCSADWPSGPRDGYLFQYLVHHLEQAGRAEEVHRLLSLETPSGLNAWYEARRQQRDVPGYRQDVQRAMSLAVLADPDLSGPERAQVLARQLRYLLTLASAKSWLQQLPAELVAALVDKGLWTTEQALDYLRVEPQPRTLIACAKALPPSAWPEVARLTSLLSDEGQRAEALSGLAECSPAWLRAEACREALAAIHRLPETARPEPAALLGHLIDAAPEDMLGDVLTLVAALAPWRLERRSCLERLLPRLPPHLLPRAHELLGAPEAFAATSIAPEASRSLLGAERARALLDQTRSIVAAGTRAQELAALAPRMPDALRDEALLAAIDAASSLPVEWMCAARLRDVASVIGGGEPARRLIAMARELRSEQAADDKARILHDTAVHCEGLPDGERLDLQRAALEAVNTVEKPLHRWRLARDLRQRLPAPLQDEAQTIGLQAMAQMDPAAALESVSEGALKAPWDTGVPRFADLVAKLHGEGRTRLMVAIKPLIGADRWVALVHDLLASPSLTPDDVERLLPSLEDELRSAALKVGFERATCVHMNGDRSDRFAWLALLAPWLSRDELAKTLVSAHPLDDDNEAARLALELAPDLPPDGYAQALWTLPKADFFIDGLRNEVPRLLRSPVPAEQASALIEAVRAIDWPPSRIDALVLLHHQGVPAAQAQALSATVLDAWREKMQESWASPNRLRLFERLVPVLVPTDLEVLLASLVPFEPRRPLHAWARCCIAARLGAPRADTVCAEALRELEYTRDDRFDLCRLVGLIGQWPCTKAPANQQVLLRLAVDDLSSFAAVAPALDPSHAADALQRFALPDLVADHRVLGDVFPHLPANARAGVLAEARIAPLAERASALAALLPSVGEAERVMLAREALRAFRRANDDLYECMGRFADPWPYFDLLQILGPSLGATRIGRLVRLARARPEGVTSAATVLALAPLEERVHVQDIERISKAYREEPHAWMLDGLASLIRRLPEPQQWEGWRLVWPLTVEGVARFAPTMSEQSRRLHVQSTLAWLGGGEEPRLSSDGRQLLALLPSCDDAQVLTALDLAWHRLEASDRLSTVAALCERAARGPRQPLVDLWRSRTEELRPLDRASLLDELTALRPVLMALGGPGMAAELFAALRDVRKWWP